jgi:hypothetical protein
MISIDSMILCPSRSVSASTSTSDRLRQTRQLVGNVQQFAMCFDWREIRRA